jgi:TPR repeat protein
MMMKQSNIFTITLLLLISAMAFPVTARAEVLSSQSSNIFKFQQKLAMNGNVHAQYKLASMYEMGDGVSADIEQAKNWYERAAEAGSVPARQRSIYLSVKEQGYDPAKNAVWLNSVRTDADEHKGQAMFLLGQLYRDGIGVNKDLEKSLELLKEVRILGVANVDKQIAAIQDEIAAKSKAKRKVAQVSPAPPTQKNQTQEIAPVKQQPSAKELAIQQAEKEAKLKQQAEAEQAEKIRRYEQAMMKLKLEQQLIDEQQARITGDEGAVDDEI